MDGEYRLGVFGRHAHQGSAPHPEKGAGPSENDGSGHSGDISGADGRREGCHEGVEGSDVALPLPGPALPKHAKAEAQPT